MNNRIGGLVWTLAVLVMGVSATATAAGPGSDRSSAYASGALLLVGEEGTSGAPISITASNPADAVQAQMKVLKQMANERGVAWRVREQVPVVPAREPTLQTVVDVVGMAGQEVVALHESVYFRFTGLTGVDLLSGLPPAKGFVDPRSGLQLPYQLGWLHLDRSKDHEGSDPGYGWSVFYSSAGIKATVYVYDLGQRLRSDEIAQKRVQDEFDSVLEQITAVHAGAEISKRKTVSDPSGKVRWLLASALMPDESSSAVALTVREGFFVKVRITWQPDKTVNEMAKESLAAIMSKVH